MSRLSRAIDSARSDMETATSSVLELRNAVIDIVLGKDDEHLCPSGKNIGEFLPLTNDISDVISKLIDISYQLEGIFFDVERERRARLG